MPTGLAAGFVARHFTVCRSVENASAHQYYTRFRWSRIFCKLYLGFFVERLHCELERTRHEVHDRRPRLGRRFRRREYG